MEIPFVRIGDHDADENHSDAVYSRNIAGKWEYAVVRWTYGSPYLRYVLRDGEYHANAGPIVIKKGPGSVLIS